jgi:hypothetical protein
MASISPKPSEKPVWSKPVLRKLDGKEAEEVRRLMLMRHGISVLNNKKSS